MKKKGEQSTNEVTFFLWKKSLEYFTENKEAENILVNSALLKQEWDSNICKMSVYKIETITELLNSNVSYNAFFHGINWIHKVINLTVPIDNVFYVFRGCRRGWDSMFYPKKGSHKIEKCYLRKVLINARQVNRLITDVDENDAFCCNVDIDELKRLGHKGALEWIERFENQKNGVGKPLPEVLKRRGMHWYELKANEVAEFFTLMNPNKRIFFARFTNEPAFVNQRLIGLNTRTGFNDAELYHALLNSILTIFSIEASGFGRGLGVLDINKDNVARCRMLNPNILSEQQRNTIVAAFEKIKGRDILPVSDELVSNDRIELEKIVFTTYGIESLLDDVINSVRSLQDVRATARTL